MGKTCTFVYWGHYAHASKVMDGKSFFHVKFHCSSSPIETNSVPRFQFTSMTTVCDYVVRHHFFEKEIPGEKHSTDMFMSHLSNEYYILLFISWQVTVYDYNQAMLMMVFCFQNPH